MINIINASGELTPEKRKTAIAAVQYNARLRQDQYRRPVKIFLAVISDYQSTKVLKNLLK